MNKKLALAAGSAGVLVVGGILLTRAPSDSGIAVDPAATELMAGKRTPWALVAGIFVIARRRRSASDSDRRKSAVSVHQLGSSPLVSHSESGATFADRHCAAKATRL